MSEETKEVILRDSEINFNGKNNKETLFAELYTSIKIYYPNNTIGPFQFFCIKRTSCLLKKIIEDKNLTNEYVDYSQNRSLNDHPSAPFGIRRRNSF